MLELRGICDFRSLREPVVYPTLLAKCKFGIHIPVYERDPTRRLWSRYSQRRDDLDFQSIGCREDTNCQSEVPKIIDDLLLDNS